jgi:hypothetical protein
MSNIRTQFIIVCDQAFLTVGSNNLNIIGIFSQINTQKLPFVYPRFALVVNFDADQAGQHILRTTVTEPTGKQVAQTELPITVTSGNTQVIANFENMQFSAPGLYSLDVFLDAKPLGQRVIQVRSVMSPPVSKANIA